MAKKLNPVEQQRVQQRKAFVKANPDLDPAAARQRFFVQTRVQELTKSGVEVTKERRAALRQQFASGDISRKGFLTPQDVQRSSTNNTNNNVVPPPVKIPGGVAAAAARAKGMVNTSTPITYGPRTTTSSTTPTSTSTSTTTSSATPKKDQNPFNNPVTRFIGKTILDTGDSLNATFVNPTVNLVGQKVFNKNPNLREAGLLESTLTTADAIATIYSAGGSKVIGTAAKSAAKPLINKFAGAAAEKGLFKTAYALEGIAARSGFRQAEKTALTKAESAALRSQASKDAAQSVFDQAPGKSRSTPKSTPKVEPEFISGGIDGPVPFKNKPGTKPPKTKPSTVTEVKGEKAVPKPKNKKTKAPKVESVDPVVGKSDKDLAPYSDTVRTGPVEMSSTQVPKTKPTPDVAPDTTPAVGSAKRVEWVRQNNPIAEPLNLDPIPDTAQTNKAVDEYTKFYDSQPSIPGPGDITPSAFKRAVESMDQPVVPTTPKPKKPKTTAPATNLSRPVTGSTKAPVETHARAGIEYPITTNFTTQQGYDNWLTTGGKEKLKELARTDSAGLIKFSVKNKKFMKSRAATKQAAEDLANKAEVDAAKKVIAHEQAIKAGTPELSPAVQEAAKLKAVEIPTTPKPKAEPAPAKKTKAKKTPAKKTKGKTSPPEGGLLDIFNKITTKGI
tara:strand:- start:10281 stop:12296 length:2016 start_codon:yes stop_codon:yes gene_type:complete